MGSTQFSKRIPTRTHVRTKRSRPKSFKSEERAKAWAEEKKLKDYSIQKVSDHKFRVIQ